MSKLLTAALLALAAIRCNSFAPSAHVTPWTKRRPTISLHRPRAAPIASSASNKQVDAVKVLCEDDAFKKPAFDEKRYRVVQFANGLRACLVSDPLAEVAGASVNVHAGSFHDPSGFSGLAHFHEHMLFLGTKLFPGEDEFDCYLSQHGGQCNAFTADEDTNFFIHSRRRSRGTTLSARRGSTSSTATRRAPTGLWPPRSRGTTGAGCWSSWWARSRRCQRT